MIHLILVIRDPNLSIRSLTIVYNVVRQLGLEIQGMSKKKGTLLKSALAKKFMSDSFEISIT